MPATGPDFISLQVRDLESSAAFYEQYLGLVRNPAEPGRPSKGQRETSRSGIHHFARPHSGSVGPRFYYRPSERSGSPICWRRVEQNLSEPAKSVAPGGSRSPATPSHSAGPCRTRPACGLAGFGADHQAVEDWSDAANQVADHVTGAHPLGKVGLWCLTTIAAPFLARTLSVRSGK
jgi:catechol 2,3-dioxygenase-like lactoylglutathione lyase family enzyme